MPCDLLDKTRRLNKVLQNSGSDPILFSDLCNILTEILECNVFVVSRHGRILGYSLYGNLDSFSIYNNLANGEYINNAFNKYLLTISDTQANNTDWNKRFIQFTSTIDRACNENLISIVPIFCGGNRLGTLIFERLDKKFTEYDLVLAEYSATIVGMEVMRAKADEAENETRKQDMVQMAITTLSYSELEAVGHIIKELNGNEGLLVASKVADRIGITRSVIVNALRKLESAGVIESRSLGMKGTYIKIINDKLINELQKIK